MEWREREENISTEAVISKYENNFHSAYVHYVWLMRHHTRTPHTAHSSRSHIGIYGDEEYECECVFICLFTWDLPYEFDYDSIKSHCVRFCSISISSPMFARVETTRSALNDPHGKNHRYIKIRFMKIHHSNFDWVYFNKIWKKKPIPWPPKAQH